MLYAGNNRNGIHPSINYPHPFSPVQDHGHLLEPITALLGQKAELKPGPYARPSQGHMKTNNHSHSLIPTGDF